MKKQNTEVEVKEKNNVAEKQTKRSKLLTVLNILLLLTLITVPAAAYWAGILNDKGVNKDVNVGTGEDLTVEVAVVDQTNGLELVPEGFAVAGVSTDEIVLTYDVSFSKGTTGAFLSLVLDTTGLHDLINVEIIEDHTNVLIDESINQVYTIKITLTEPANKAEYDEVAGKTHSFKLTFKLTN